jgi:hypothetical protein
MEKIALPCRDTFGGPPPSMFVFMAKDHFDAAVALTALC